MGGCLGKSALEKKRGEEDASSTMQDMMGMVAGQPQSLADVIMRDVVLKRRYWRKAGTPDSKEILWMSENNSKMLTLTQEICVRVV